jgi:hypothetical protein
VRGEALAVLRTVAADLFFNRWVPFGTYQGAFENFCAPELYAVGPDWFKYCLINEDFVVGR